MKFASHQATYLVQICGFSNTRLSNEEALGYIDKMYSVAYGSRAGLSVVIRYQNDCLTPNEERLMTTLQERFGSADQAVSLRGKLSALRNNPVTVDCGDHIFVFAREHDEYGSSVTWTESHIVDYL